MTGDDVVKTELLEGITLPQDSLVMGLMRVVTYIDGEGVERLFTKFDGDQSMSTTVGTLEAAKQMYLNDWLGTPYGAEEQD